MTADLNIAELRALADAIAIEAGELVLAKVGTAFAHETKSSSVDVVTEVDRAAEELIVARILSARPDDGILGEEGTNVDGTSGVSWVIDPIDGTTNFLYGLPGFCVSVAVAAQPPGQSTFTEVLAGAVVDPMHRTPFGDGTLPSSPDIYSAGRGLGATRNGDPISATQKADLATALVATGFSFQSDRRGRQAVVLNRLLPEVRDIRRFGSAAMDLCHVAAGRVDAYFEVGLNPWDLAAGSLIAAEAGAVVTIEPTGEDDQFTLAAAPGIATELRALLDEAGAAAV